MKSGMAPLLLTRRFVCLCLLAAAAACGSGEGNAGSE